MAVTLPDPPDSSLLNGSVVIQLNIGGQPTNVLYLPVNPDIRVDTDIRVTIYQVETGVYADDFGQGLQKITLTGNTAWRSPKGRYNGQPVNGYDASVVLYRDIINAYFLNEQGNSNPTNVEMIITDSTSNGCWSVKPIPPGLSMWRSKNDPVVFYYQCSFIVIKDLMHDPASPSDKPSDPVQSAVVNSTGPAASAQPPPAVISATKNSQNVSQTPQQTYTVVSGDSLWAIATKFYGNGTLWPRIYAANKAYIRNPNLIFPGQKLVIPPALNANMAS